MNHWATDHLRITLHRLQASVTPEEAQDAAGLGSQDYQLAIQELSEAGELEYHEGGRRLSLRDDEHPAEDEAFSEQPTTKMAAVSAPGPADPELLINAYLAVRLEDADEDITVGQLRQDAEEFAAIAPRVWERLR